MAAVSPIGCEGWEMYSLMSFLGGFRTGPSTHIVYIDPQKNRKRHPHSKGSGNRTTLYSRTTRGCFKSPPAPNSWRRSATKNTLDVRASLGSTILSIPPNRSEHQLPPIPPHPSTLPSTLPVPWLRDSEPRECWAPCLRHTWKNFWRSKDATRGSWCKY